MQRFIAYTPAHTMTASLSKGISNKSQTYHSVKQKAGLGPNLS